MLKDSFLTSYLTAYGNELLEITNLTYKNSENTTWSIAYFGVCVLTKHYKSDNMNQKKDICVCFLDVAYVSVKRHFLYECTFDHSSSHLSLTCF